MNTYMDDTNSAKESVYFGEVSTRTAFNDFVNPSWVWDAAFGCTNVAYYGDLMGAVTFCLRRFLHSISYAGQFSSEMVPDKVVNAIVLWDCLESAILALICSCRATDRHVVDVGNGELGNLQLKDMCDIVVEHWDSVGPTHG